MFLLVIIVLVGPVLAIAAFVRVSRLAPLLDQIPKLTARIFALERKLSELEHGPRPLAAPADVKLADAAAPKQPEVIWQRPDSAPAVLSHGSEPAHAAIPGAPHAGSVTAAPPSPTAPAPQLFAASVHSGSAPRLDSDVETMIAGHWFYYVGILALALAATFFLKYAFENDWIGPTGRVAIGIVVGSALFPFSQWILTRGYKYFSEGLAGLGAAILYLSIWAGWHYYQLFGQTPRVRDHDCSNRDCQPLWRSREFAAYCRAGADRRRADTHAGKHRHERRSGAVHLSSRCWRRRCW